MASQLEGSLGLAFLSTPRVGVGRRDGPPWVPWGEQDTGRGEARSVQSARGQFGGTLRTTN